MSLGQLYRVATQVGSQRRKTLALVGALVLTASAFVFASRHAQAQELPQAQEQHIMVTDEGVTEPATGASPIEASPAKTSSAESSPLYKSPLPATGSTSEILVDPTPPVPLPADQYDSGIPVNIVQVYAEPASLVTESGLAPAGDTVQPVDLTPASGSVDPDSAPTTLEPAPESVALEENEALWLVVEESSTSEPAILDSVEGEPYLLSSLEDSMGSSMVETLESAATIALEIITDGSLYPSVAEDGALVDAALASLVSGGEADRAAVSGPAEDPGSSPIGSESPLRDTPQPVSPFALPAGSSFSLSGGEIGSSGVALLLLCILASGLILLRRDGKLSWAFYELPKPSSALLLPLERPG